jgi:hypothetical protein
VTEAKPMQAILRRLLDRLDAIAEQHGEVSDTAVRDVISEAVFDGFLRPSSGFALPDRYAMFSEEGDLLVKRALAEFLPAANYSAAEAELSTFHERLSALQDIDVRSAGGSYVDDYLGWADPEDYDASGAVRPRHDA